MAHPGCSTSRREGHAPRPASRPAFLSIAIVGILAVLEIAVVLVNGGVKTGHAAAPERGGRMWTNCGPFWSRAQGRTIFLLWSATLRNCGFITEWSED